MAPRALGLLCWNSACLAKWIDHRVSLDYVVVIGISNISVYPACNGPPLGKWLTVTASSNENWSFYLGISSIGMPKPKERSIRTDISGKKAPLEAEFARGSSLGSILYDVVVKKSVDRVPYKDRKRLEVLSDCAYQSNQII